MLGAFSVSPQSRSLFSASFQTFCLTAHAYLNTQKYGLFCSLPFELLAGFVLGSPKFRVFLQVPSSQKKQRSQLGCIGCIVSFVVINQGHPTRI